MPGGRLRLLCLLSDGGQYPGGKKWCSPSRAPCAQEAAHTHTRHTPRAPAEANKCTQAPLPLAHRSQVERAGRKRADLGMLQLLVPAPAATPATPAATADQAPHEAAHRTPTAPLAARRAP